VHRDILPERLRIITDARYAPAFTGQGVATILRA